MAMEPKIDLDKLGDLSEFQKLAVEIDALISQLQVFGCQVIINNDNLCDYHNISVYRFEK